MYENKTAKPIEIILRSSLEEIADSKSTARNVHEEHGPSYPIRLQRSY
jgi:hypothetical protein